VRKAQDHVQELRNEGYHVIIVGNRNHAEVEGLLGYAGKAVHVLWNVKDLELLEEVQRMGVVAQTTTPFERFRLLVGGLLEKSRQLKIYNTICHSTEKRQIQTLELAKRADVMIIIGGRNSANTTRLAELCRDLGKATYHVETADEVCLDWVKGASRVGVSAGASTPDWIIEGVMHTLEGGSPPSDGARGLAQCM
jgi:4-hydroxy-3-methylbut-2-enyl diphosphate reductase